MARVLDWVGNILLSLATVVIIIGYIGIVITSGWGKLWDILSPFNIFNWLAVLAALAPGFIVKILAKRLWHN